MIESILERWDITVEELTQVVDQNPSLRGMLLGYLAELKLEKLWLRREGVSHVSNLALRDLDEDEEIGVVLSRVHLMDDPAHSGLVGTHQHEQILAEEANLGE